MMPFNYRVLRYTSNCIIICYGKITIYLGSWHPLANTFSLPLLIYDRKKCLN